MNCIDTMYCLLHAKIIQSSWPYYFLCGTIISKWFGYIIHLHKTDWINLFLLIDQFGSVHSYDLFYTQAEWNKSSYLKFYLYASLKLSKVKLRVYDKIKELLFRVDVWTWSWFIKIIWSVYSYFLFTWSLIDTSD